MKNTFSLAGLAGALIIAVAAPARAQITSVVAPPRPARTVERKQEAQAQAHAPKRDTAVAVRMSNMRAWVDSASNVAVATAAAMPRDTSARDSTARVAASKPAPAMTPRTTPAKSPAPDATTFHNGAAAPATASPLAAIAIPGALLLLAGLALTRAPATDRAASRQ